MISLVELGCSAEKSSRPDFSMPLRSSPSGYCATVRTPRRLPTTDAAVLPACAPPRHATEYLLHGFRRGGQFVLQNDYSCFIQNAVRAGAISQIHTTGQLPLENVVSTRPHSANLLHCRSPFLCASSTSNIGSVSHPARRPAFSSHLEIGEVRTSTPSVESSTQLAIAHVDCQR